jgi:hypothetical protein
MSDKKHPVDDLFKKGLGNYSVDVPGHIWEKIEHRRSPLHKFLNRFRQNGWYGGGAVAGIIMLGASFVIFWPSAEPSAIRSGHKFTDTGAGAGQEEAVRADFREEKSSLSKKRPEEKEAVFLSQSSDKVFSKENQTPGSAKIKGRHAFPPETDPLTNQQHGEEYAEGEMTALTLKEALVISGKKALSFSVKSAAMEKPSEMLAYESALQESKSAGTSAIYSPSPWSLELQASYDHVRQSVHSPDQHYVDLRKAREISGPAFSIQGRLAYRLSSFFSFKTGISYSRIHETLKYANKYEYDQPEKRIYTGTVIDPISGPQTITYTVHDTVRAVGYTPAKSKNAYVFVDVPLVLSYDLYTGNKWKVSLGAGTLLNLYFAQRGKYIQTGSYETADLEAPGSPFRNRAGATFVFNMGFSYRLNDHVDLLLEPAVKAGSSLLMPDFSARQVANTYSLFSGIRYRF